MGKTSAKVEHRDYVPWGWIAIPFCRVSFFGVDAEKLDKQWNEITSKRYQEYNFIYELNIKKIEKMKSDIKNIEDSIHRPWYRFWDTPEEKTKKREIEKIQQEIQKLELKNIDIGKKRWFDSYEYRRRLEDFLQKNGFYLNDTSSSGDECKTHTEVWLKD